MQRQPSKTDQFSGLITGRARASIAQGCSFLSPAPFFISLLIGLLAINVGRAEPVITEFMASNKATLSDEDGSYSDWIEIYNPDLKAVSLSGWFLTDSAKNKTKWSIPA